MATPESKVKAKIHALLKAHGAYAVNYIGGMHANNGTPDILACLCGVFVAIEAKAGKNKPTDLQISNLRRIDEAGGSALVINEENLPLLDGLLATIRISRTSISNYENFVRKPTEETDAPKRRTTAKER